VSLRPQKETPLRSRENARKSVREESRIRTREKIIEHDDGEGNWLVSYADMMTLLVGFFVMITAFSTPDPQKIEKLREATSEAMGGEYVKPLQELTAGLKRVLQEAEIENAVSVENTGDGAVLSVKGTLFFDSGSAEIKADAMSVVQKLASVLTREAEGFRIVVEGHTDDSPIATAKFPSNWELSSARAGTVVRLFEQSGVPHRDLKPVGLSDTVPLMPNRTPAGEPILENQARNRRIVIRIQKR
jgi:chemotaxis protein MotB